MVNGSLNITALKKAGIFMSNGLIDEKLTCNSCKYAIFKDYGYSNYTTEGTQFYCAKNLHPADGFDRFYGEDKRLDYAAKCGGFECGDSIEMDVDGEVELTPEQQTIYDGWNT